MKQIDKEVEENSAAKGKAERREQKKARRKFKLHGSTIRMIYQNVIRRRLREKR